MGFSSLFRRMIVDRLPGRNASADPGYRYDFDPTSQTYTQTAGAGMKKGGMVKSSASKRADGIAQRGKTKGRMV